jgi:Mn-dependent DtxR family transcriptional regulator
LAEFFRIIGIDDEIANNDAEGIEHHLHHDTQEIQGIYDRNEGQADIDY